MIHEWLLKNHNRIARSLHFGGNGERGTDGRGALICKKEGLGSLKITRVEVSLSLSLIFFCSRNLTHSTVIMP